MTLPEFDPLRAMTYPGRGIILGLDPSGERRAVVYFITGRSPSSQARRLVLEGGTVWTRPTNPDVLKKGNPELLIYSAVIAGEGLAVSNGRQTADIAARIASGRSPREILVEALEKWDYEPDAPIFTPRISGCVTGDGRAALSLVFRSASGATARDVFDVFAQPGRGALLTTYRGGDTDPIMPFQGSPLDARLEAASADDLAASVYETLAPGAEAPDYRVAVAAVMIQPGCPSGGEFRIINRQERTSAHGPFP